MYGAAANGSVPQTRREIRRAEQMVDCPICRAPKGKACVLWSRFDRYDYDKDEHAGDPHNGRFTKAGVNPYSEIE